MAKSDKYKNILRSVPGGIVDFNEMCAEMDALESDLKLERAAALELGARCAEDYPEGESYVCRDIAASIRKQKGNAASALDKHDAEIYELGRQDGLNQKWEWPPKPESGDVRRALDKLLVEARFNQTEKIRRQWVECVRFGEWLTDELAALRAACGKVDVPRDSGKAASQPTGTPEERER